MQKKLRRRKREIRRRRRRCRRKEKKKEKIEAKGERMRRKTHKFPLSLHLQEQKGRKFFAGFTGSRVENFVFFFPPPQKRFVKRKTHQSSEKRGFIEGIVTKKRTYRPEIEEIFFFILRYF
jgi:hypothetical protein